MYELVYSEKALKQLKKLEKQMQERILYALERIRIKPESHVKRLVGEPHYSFRVGDYRVILDLQRDKLIILIISMGYRRDIYK